MKTRPNDPCHCGSGKKYKKCCFNATSSLPSNADQQCVAISELMQYANDREMDRQTELLENGGLNNNKDQLEEFKELSTNIQMRRQMLKDYVPLMCHVLDITKEEWTRFYDREKDDYVIMFFESIFNSMKMIAKIEKVSVAEVETKLKNGNFLIDRGNIMPKDSPLGFMNHEELFAVGKGYAQVYMDAIDRNLDASCSADIALDLASGAGVFPFEYSYRSFQSDTGRILNWYPSEWRNPTGRRSPLAVLRIALASRTLEEKKLPGFKIFNTQGYRSSTACGQFKRWEEILNNPAGGSEFADLTGFLGSGAYELPLYPGHNIKLVGLKSKQFNHKRGKIIEKDPKSPDRIAVLLEGNTKPISFKTVNLVNLDSKGTANLLLFRSIELDLEEGSTWYSNRAAPLLGRCAVVTCASLMTQVGKRAPLLWKKAMFLASEMLAPGGIFVQHDTVAYGDFGRSEKMREYVEETGLGLELVECSEPIKDTAATESWAKMLLLVWKKTE